MAYHYNNKKARPIRTTFTEEEEVQFWYKTNQLSGLGPNGDCWEWTGAKYQNEHGTDGYGRLTIRRENLRAHRVAYMLANKENPGFQMVLHSCDNPACVRPEHLSLGDAKKNKADNVARGRQGKGMNAGPATRSVFDPERIKAIRRAWASGTISQGQLSLIAGTKQKTMNDILRRVSWNYPECEP